jgi:hypothetical protein
MTFARQELYEARVRPRREQGIVYWCVISAEDSPHGQSIATLEKKFGIFPPIAPLASYLVVVNPAERGLGSARRADGSPRESQDNAFLTSTWHHALGC